MSGTANSKTGKGGGCFACLKCVSRPEEVVEPRPVIISSQAQAVTIPSKNEAPAAGPTITIQQSHVSSAEQSSIPVENELPASQESPPEIRLTEEQETTAMDQVGNSSAEPQRHLYVGQQPETSLNGVVLESAERGNEHESIAHNLEVETLEDRDELGYHDPVLPAEDEVRQQENMEEVDEQPVGDLPRDESVESLVSESGVVPEDSPYNRMDSYETGSVPYVSISGMDVPRESSCEVVTTHVEEEEEEEVDVATAPPAVEYEGRESPVEDNPPMTREEFHDEEEEVLECLDTNERHDNGSEGEQVNGERDAKPPVVPSLNLIAEKPREHFKGKGTQEKQAAAVKAVISSDDFIAQMEREFAEFEEKERRKALRKQKEETKSSTKRDAYEKPWLTGSGGPNGSAPSSPRKGSLGPSKLRSTYPVGSVLNPNNEQTDLRKTRPDMSARPWREPAPRRPSNHVVMKNVLGQDINSPRLGRKHPRYVGLQQHLRLEAKEAERVHKALEAERKRKEQEVNLVKLKQEEEEKRRLVVQRRTHYAQTSIQSKYRHFTPPKAPPPFQPKPSPRNRKPWEWRTKKAEMHRTENRSRSPMRKSKEEQATAPVMTKPAPITAEQLASLNDTPPFSQSPLPFGLEANTSFESHPLDSHPIDTGGDEPAHQSNCSSLDPTPEMDFFSPMSKLETPSFSKGTHPADTTTVDPDEADELDRYETEQLEDVESDAEDPDEAPVLDRYYTVPEEEEGVESDAEDPDEAPILDRYDTVPEEEEDVESDAEDPDEVHVLDRFDTVPEQQEDSENDSEEHKEISNEAEGDDKEQHDQGTLETPQVSDCVQLLPPDDTEDEVVVIDMEEMEDVQPQVHHQYAEDDKVYVEDARIVEAEAETDQQEEYSRQESDDEALSAQQTPNFKQNQKPLEVMPRTHNRVTSFTESIDEDRVLEDDEASLQMPYQPIHKQSPSLQEDENDSECASDTEKFGDVASGLASETKSEASSVWGRPPITGISEAGSLNQPENLQKLIREESIVSSVKSVIVHSDSDFDEENEESRTSYSKCAASTSAVPKTLNTQPSWSANALYSMDRNGKHSEPNTPNTDDSPVSYQQMHATELTEVAHISTELTRQLTFSNNALFEEEKS